MLRRGFVNFVNSVRAYSVQAEASNVHALQETAMLKEQCILVDENDKAIGHASKKDCHKVGPDGSVKLHRAFSVFLFNTKGEMMIQRRAKHKITFPDTYANACCSHPLQNITGETLELNCLGVRMAASRRLNYELGIPTSQTRPEDFHFVTRVHYQDNGDGVWGEHEIDYILILTRDVTVKPNPSEVSEIRWIHRNQLDQEIAKLDAPLTPWFDLILKKRLTTWWDNLHQLKQYEDVKNIQRF